MHGMLSSATPPFIRHPLLFSNTNTQLNCAESRGLRTHVGRTLGEFPKISPRFTPIPLPLSAPNSCSQVCGRAKTEIDQQSSCRPINAVSTTYRLPFNGRLHDEPEPTKTQQWCGVYAISILDFRAATHWTCEDNGVVETLLQISYIMVSSTLETWTCQAATRSTR